MPQQRVAVAMSGGVDSSMAAAILKEAGYEVSGVHMQLWTGWGGAAADLERVCQLLDIPLYEFDFEAEFKSLIIDHFCREYGSGRTPNPCIRCNRYIKFDALWQRARELGVDFMATGHYARIEHAPEGYQLMKAFDRSKDQSYFLYTLGQRELEHLLFPVGDLQKSEVRKLAGKLGLPAANRRDSQDVCFIPDSDYRSFVAQHVSLEAGDIVDSWGKVLGRHGGLAYYTVGQRHKLGLVANKRLYVVRLDAANNRVVVGSEDELFGDRLVAGELSWVAGEPPVSGVGVTAKIRYKAAEAEARLRLNGGAAEVRFSRPRRSITPGQAVVFYQDDAVLGGGIIADADSLRYH